MPPMVHGAATGGMSGAIANMEAAEARKLQQALTKAFSEIDEDGGGTLDREELIQMFAANGITAATKDIDDLIRDANDAAADEDVGGMEVSFDAFSNWIQSSSSLANEMRHALGGVLEDKLDIDQLGIEERELWARTERGYIYRGDSVRQTLFIVLEEANSSRIAKAISLLMMTLITFSTAMFVLESVDSVKQLYPQTFVFAEAFCILSFTIEYLLRLWSCVERPYRDKRFFSYFTTPMNVVDIVAILPFYLELLLQAGGSFGVIRVLRLARVFRVMKVGSMSDNLTLVGEGLSRSVSGLTVVMYLMALFVVISAATMHMLEWDPVECAKDTPNETVSPCTVGFDTIPDSTWFVMVTMTSVGYGDYSPSGDLGKLVASAIMIVGVLSIAIPITLIGNKFSEVWVEAQVEKGTKRTRNLMQMTARGCNENSAEYLGYDDAGGQYKCDLKTIETVFEETPPGKFQRKHLGIVWYRGTEVSTNREVVLVRSVLSGSHAALLPYFMDLQHDVELKNERLELKTINGESVDEMEYETVVQKANTAARPLTLKLTERHHTDVVASDKQRKLDRSLRAEAIMWSIQALVSDGIIATEGESPQLATLVRVLTVLQTQEEDSPVQTALAALLRTAEEQVSDAADVDATSLLRSAVAAEMQRNEKRDVAAPVELDGSGDGVSDL